MRFVFMRQNLNIVSVQFT